MTAARAPQAPLPLPPHAPARLPPYRREGDAYLIELNLGRLPQLFNSLDPSPFHEKDLDPEADAYLVGAVRELGPKTRAKLVIHLPAPELEWADKAHVGEAVRNYFTYRAATTRRDLRLAFRRGRVSLVVGLAFLLGCIALRELVLSLSGTTIAHAVAEGLVILGWVAMWGPLQVFLYDWWPMAQTRAVLDRLAAIEVELRRTEE